MDAGRKLYVFLVFAMLTFHNYRDIFETGGKTFRLFCRLTIMVWGCGLMVSCTTSEKEQRNFKEIRFSRKDLPETVKLKLLRTITIPGFYTPLWMFRIENNLLIVDLNHREGILAVYSLSKDSLLRVMMPKGNGPFEIQSISSIVTDGHRNIYFYDTQERRLLQGHLDSLAYSVHQPRFYKRLRWTYTTDTPLSIINHSDSTYLSTSELGHGGRFNILNHRFEFSPEYFGEYPDLEHTREIKNMTHTEYRVNVLSNLFSHGICLSSDRQSLVVAYLRVDCIEVFDMKSRALRYRIIGPEQNFPPRYKLNKAGQGLPCSECYAGYSSPQVTSNYILSLRRYRQDKEWNSHLSRYIYVFSQAGTVKKILELDEDIISFVIDEERGRLYGLVVDAPYAVVEYELQI